MHRPIARVHRRSADTVTRAAVTATLALALAPHAAQALDRYWVNASASATWNNLTSNWSATSGGASGATVPGSGDNATLNLTAAADKAVTLGVNYAAFPLQNLTIEGTAANSMTFVQPAGFGMSSVNVTVGNTGRGNYTQNGNTLSFSGQLNIGNGAAGNGTYTLNGGTLTNTGSAFAAVGKNGDGTFNQTGGLHTGHASYQVHIGDNSGSTGLYSLSGIGVLNVYHVSVGSGGVGSFVQSGGTLGTTGVTGAFDPDITVGASSVAGSTGTYSISAGTVAVRDITVGSQGTGIFNQSGGLVRGTGSDPLIVFMGYSNSTGTYNLSGGQLQATQITLGDGGTAVFNHTGGTATVDHVIVSSFSSGTSNGSYGVNGASALLNAKALTVGSDDTAQFLLTEGTVNVTERLIVSRSDGASGTLVVQGGTFTAGHTAGATEAAVIGESGYALAGITGGSLTIGSAAFPTETVIGEDAGSDGTYISLNGVTTFHGAVKLATNGGKGTLQSSGGAINMMQPLFVGTAPGANATFQLLAGTVTLPAATNFGTIEFAGGTLQGPGGPANTIVTNFGTIKGIAPTGIPPLFNAAIHNYGTVTAIAGGTFTASAGINNFATVEVPQNGTIAVAGNGLVNDGTVSLAGGTLTSTVPLNNNGSVTGHGTITGAGMFNNYANLTVAGGNLTLSTNTNSNFGTATLSPGWQLRTQTSFFNYGLLDLNGGAVNNSAPSFGNMFGGVITGKGTILGPNFINNGTIQLTTGLTNVVSPFASSGSILLTSQTASLNGGTLSNAGTLQGIGTVGNNVNNTGVLRASGPGVLVIGGTLNNQSSGLLSATPGSTLLLIKGLSNSNPNLGTISLAGGAIDTNNISLWNNNQLTGHGTLTTGGVGLVNNATVTFTGGPTTVNGGVVNQPGQTIKVLYNPATFTGPVTNNGTLNVLSTTAVFAQGLTGNPVAAPGGLDQLTTGANFSGTLAVDPTGSSTANYVRQDTVNSSGNIFIRPTGQGGGTSFANTLTLTGNGTFDLADTKMVISAATPLPTVRSYLLTTRLSSSTANADPQHRLAIGYALASQLGATTWGGLDVDPTSLLTKLTYLGDANLDGKINADDFALIDKGSKTNGTTWTAGDFNYDGAVTPADYLLIDRVYTQQSGLLSPSAAFLSQRQSQFGPGYVQQLLTSIPEPTSLAACGLALPAALRRRRR